MRTRVLGVLGLGAAMVTAAIGCSGSDAAPTTSTPDSGTAVPDAAGDAGANDAARADAIAPKPRGFRMGFTPFPFAATVEGRDLAYDYLAKDADLYAFHQMAGVPWKAAAAGKKLAEWGTSIRTMFEFQRAAKDAHKDHAVYLAVSPLDDDRKRLSDEWDENEHMPLEAPWSAYAFDAPAVKAAYLAYCEEAIAVYAPQYFAIGIEVNLLKRNTPSAWAAYVTLHRETYQALKAKHKDLPIFATFTVVDVHSSYADGDPASQLQAVADILPYSDYFAISFYPYMSKHLTGPMPADTLDKLATNAGGNPIAIAQHG